MSQATFLWHDYETWGANPKIDRPSQFAAIRTDEKLNPIGEPAMWYCQPPVDLLPSPEAAMITGISPFKAQQEGLAEPEFVANIDALMSQANTCSVGYNSIRFDDEVTRFSRFRNFYDAYEREWKNGNSRFDLIDVVRLCGVLRPDGIEWPFNDDGLPSFKLEHLTAANGIEQQGAHDALVDVRATIDVAKLIMQKQPKLWAYALGMRNKKQVQQQLMIGSGKPVLHASGMFGSENYCLSAVLPLAQHPSNNNAIVCIDLRYSPEDFIKLDVEEIRERIFTPKDELGEKARVQLKSVHINKCPMVMPIGMLDDAAAERANLDKQLLRKNYDLLLEHRDAWVKAAQVFEPQDADDAMATDVDASLYHGGFLSYADKALCEQVRQANADVLAGLSFEDARMNQLLFRYRARYFYGSLSLAEQQRWGEFCRERLMLPEKGSGLSLEAFQQSLQDICTRPLTDAQQVLLQDVERWAQLLINQELQR